MEPITIDSSDEEDTAPNEAYDRPTTGRDPRLRPGAYYAGRPTRACPTGIRQVRGPTRAPSFPMRPSTARAPPRRATPHPMTESSDESPAASPTRRPAPPTPPRPSGRSRAPSPPMRPSTARAPPRRATSHPMSESSDESPAASPTRRAAPPTPPRPSGRSVSPFYTDRTGRRIPCSQAPPSGPYQGSYNPGPPNPDAPGHSRWFHNPRPAPGYPDPTAAAPPTAERYSPRSPRQQDSESDEDDDEEGDSRSSSPAAPARDEDYVLEDATDSDATPLYPGEEAGDQSNDDAQTISSDSETNDGAPRAAHYQWEGEERYGFWRGSWIQLIHARYTSILIEAPFRPTPDPIVTFPPSPERLCIMAPDEDWEMDWGNNPEVRPPSPALGEDAVLPIFPGDRADDNAPRASTSQQALRHITGKAYDDAPRASTSRQALHHLSDQIDDNAPLTSSSQGSIPIADETTEHAYQPTGKAMLWESQSSDSETETGQKFRRKEAQPRPAPNPVMPDQRSSAHRRGTATAMNALHHAAETNRRAANPSRSTTHEEITPPATPRAGLGDRGFDLSPGTMDILMEELEPGVEGLVQGLIPDWDPSVPSTAPMPTTTTVDEVPPPAPRFPRPVTTATIAHEVPPPAPRFPRPGPVDLTADEVPPPAPRFARRAPPAEDFTTDDPAPERVAIPSAWWTNTHDQRVPLAVWQEVERRSHAAQYSRQRFRVRTPEGPYQITMKTTGDVQIRFGRAD
ncbi:nascent polypeptide-associated complex subunit alpha, muscle-specific form-like [Drosophila kikkawai]|uniref:Nascent polypeptide-associated complex subunit alpha, muscle-specific form-like n=1 Tax=Drosophila kikkawai TaxID=30033 RepID=A0ABM3C892_DROKI